MRVIFVIGFLFAAGGLARADDAAAGAKAVVAAQADAQEDSDFGATFTSDGLLLLGGHAVIGPDAIGNAWGSSDEVTGAFVDVSVRKATHVVVGQIGTEAAWLTADLLISGKTIAGEDGVSKRVSWSIAISELVVRDGSGWKAKAAQISKPVKDADAKKAAADAQPDAIPGASADADREKSIGVAALAAALGSDKAVAVIGSAPKERATGAAKVKKLLKKWAKLPFAVNGGVLRVDGETWSYEAARVDLTIGKVTIPYDVLVIIGGILDNTVVCVHYAFAGAM